MLTRLYPVKVFTPYPLTFPVLTPPPDVLAIFMRTTQRLHASLERLKDHWLFIRPNFTQNAHLECINILEEDREKVK